MVRPTYKTLIFIFLAIFLVLNIPIVSQDRVPKPEFDNNYQIPTPTTPNPDSIFFGFVEISLLCVFLTAVSYFVIRRRSRIGIILTGICSLVLLGFAKKGCVCSVASIQNITLALFHPEYVIPIATVLAFILPLLFALLFGRVFCAGVCPFGVLQDIVQIYSYRVPVLLSSVLSCIPYFYLGIAVVMASTGSAFLICRYDPFITIFRWSGTWQMVSLCICILALSMIVARPYCRFLCPYSVLLRWCSYLSWKHISISPDSCENCRLCHTACPIDAIIPSSPIMRGSLSTIPNTIAEQVLPQSVRNVAIRNIKILFVLIIPIFWISIVSSQYLAASLSHLHPTVYMASLVEEGKLHEYEILEIQAFLESGKSTSELQSEAEAIRKTTEQRGTWLGICIAIVFLGKMWYVIHQKAALTYHPDMGECISCGKCWACCPRIPKA